MAAWRSCLRQFNNLRSHRAERQGQERCAKIGRISVKIGETSERIAETFAKIGESCGTIGNPVLVLERFPKIARTSAKTGATFETITGISGMTDTIGVRATEPYGMARGGREATDGKPTQKVKSRQEPR